MFKKEGWNLALGGIEPGFSRSSTSDYPLCRQWLTSHCIIEMNCTIKLSCDYIGSICSLGVRLRSAMKIDFRIINEMLVPMYNRFLFVFNSSISTSCIAAGKSNEARIDRIAY